MAQVAEGWLTMQYTGPEHAVVQIKVGDAFYPAYLDFSGSKRVARIRPPETPLRPGTIVELWVDGGILRAERFHR